MKNIIIKENGETQQFDDVCKIKTEGTGGTEWVPKDDYDFAVKTIKSNGLYNPSSDGVEGYLAIFVNVPPLQQITGVDPSDGKKYILKKDFLGNILRIPVD